LLSRRSFPAHTFGAVSTFVLLWSTVMPTWIRRYLFTHYTPEILLNLVFEDLRRPKVPNTIPPIDELKRRAYCKWHNSFSHATNDCNVFRRQVQSAINEGQLAFQEMQVDTQPFPVNTIDVACEKVLVRPEMADKSKSKDIITDDPRTSNMSQKENARKAMDNKTNKSGSAGGQTQLRSQARQPDLSITDGPTPTCGQSGAHKDGLAGSARQSAHGQRRQRPHKARKEMRGQSEHDAHGRLAKDDPTFDQLLAENASKKTVPYDRSTKKPRSPTKMKCRTKRPKRRNNKHRMFILWDQGTFHPFIHRRYIILFKYGMVRRWIHVTCIVPLSIQTEGTSIIFLLIHWSNGHGRGRYNPKRPLYIDALLNDLYFEKPVTYIRFSWYAFGSSTFTKRQWAYIGHKKGLADGPALRPDGPQSGLSAVVARTVRACAETVSVPSFLRDLLPKTAGLTREIVWSGSRPPLYIDEGLRSIKPPNNRSNQVYFSFLPYALGVVLV
jgi:hypothetical protein